VGRVHCCDFLRQSSIFSRRWYCLIASPNTLFKKLKVVRYIL
jgi:hypothetical protein